MGHRETQQGYDYSSSGARAMRPCRCGCRVNQHIDKMECMNHRECDEFRPNMGELKGHPKGAKDGVL